MNAENSQPNSPALPQSSCSALLGAGVEQPDGSVTCAACGHDAEWGECTACGGEGGHDGYEDDPNWYRPGEIVSCCQCDGAGGDWWCENSECSTQQIWKITKAPNAALCDGTVENPKR